MFVTALSSAAGVFASLLDISCSNVYYAEAINIDMAC